MPFQVLKVLGLVGCAENIAVGRVGSEITLPLSRLTANLAKDAAIVFEAKDERGYKVRDMLVEIEEARKNRGVTFGVFVISTGCAPAGMPAFKRYGQ